MQKKQIMVLVMALTLGITGLSTAGPGKHGMGMGGGMMFQQLDLTNQQQEQVKTVMDKYQAEMQGLGEKIDAARQAVHAAVHADVFDEQSIREAHKKLATEMENMAVLRGKVYSEIRPFLTPEQITRLKKMKGREHGKMHQAPKCPVLPEE